MFNRLALVFLFFIFSPIQSFSMEMDFEIETIDIFNGEPTTHRKMKAGNHKHGCPKIKFTKEQKTMYKEVQDVFGKQISETKEEYLVAKKKYFSYLRKNDQNIQTVGGLQNQLTQVRTELEEARADFFHFIMNEVAHPNQRPELLKCFHHMRHHRRVKELRIHEKKHRQAHKTVK